MSYWIAKARHPAEGAEGIVAVIVAWPDTHLRMHTTRRGRGGMPFGSSGPTTVDEAKQRCQQTMGIQFDEWSAHDGDAVDAFTRASGMCEGEV